jgi:hypothetical protein
LRSLDVGDRLLDLGRDLRRRASSGFRSQSCPTIRFSSGLAIAPFSNYSICANAAASAGYIRPRKASSNRIRLTSSVNPSDGMRQKYF